MTTLRKTTGPFVFVAKTLGLFLAVAVETNATAITSARLLAHNAIGGIRNAAHTV